jgi:hypothetical protein
MAVVAATLRVVGWTPKDELSDCTLQDSEGETINKAGTYGKRAGKGSAVRTTTRKCFTASPRGS